MENQHRKISGYRELTQAEIDLMNDIKTLGPQIEAVLLRVSGHVEIQFEEADTDEVSRLIAADPYGWVEIAKANFQQGLMALTRAVAQPTFF